MNEFELLVEDLRKAFPDAVLKIDHPEKPTGNYWLDVKRGEKSVTIEWRPAKGFGFYAKDAGYGEGPKEILRDRRQAFNHISFLLGI